MRARLEALFRGFEAPCPRAGETLQVIRGIQILEGIGSPLARAALEEIAQHQPPSRLARKAKVPLGRVRN